MNCEECNNTGMKITRFRDTDHLHPCECCDRFELGGDYTKLHKAAQENDLDIPVERVDFP